MYVTVTVKDALPEKPIVMVSAKPVCAVFIVKIVRC